MKTCIAAWTAPSGPLPPYFNLTLDGEEVVITVRSAGTSREGVYVCSHRPGLGRCTAGGPTCNNYCNMAPAKGPMQKHPLPCTHHDVGPTAAMRMDASTLRQLLAGALDVLERDLAPAAKAGTASS